MQVIDIHYELLALVDGVIDLLEFGQAVGNKLRKLPSKYQTQTWRWLIDRFEDSLRARSVNDFMERLYFFCVSNEIKVKLFDPRKEQK